MRLGERCDEIVRLIEETLAEVGVDGRPAPAVGAPAPRSRSGAGRPATTASGAGR